MYDALIGLYTTNNIGQAMSSKNELRDVRMTRNDIIASYFMRVSQLRDQLQAIDEIIPEKELVTTTLNCLLESWDSFALRICARKESPNFDELWIACTQEESRHMLREKIQRSKEGDSQAYVAHFKKGGGRKKFSFQRRSEGRRPEGRIYAPQGKRDMSKIKCYHSHKFGHYRSDCPERSNYRKRKGKQHAAVADFEELPKKPKNEESGDKYFFYFFAFTVSIADSDDLWLVDSGASKAHDRLL